MAFRGCSKLGMRLVKALLGGLLTPKRSARSAGAASRVMVSTAGAWREGNWHSLVLGGHLGHEVLEWRAARDTLGRGCMGCPSKRRRRQWLLRRGYCMLICGFFERNAQSKIPDLAVGKFDSYRVGDAARVPGVQEHEMIHLYT